MIFIPLHYWCESNSIAQVYVKQFPPCDRQQGIQVQYQFQLVIIYVYVGIGARLWWIFH